MKKMTKAAPPTAIPTIAPAGRCTPPDWGDVPFVCEGREDGP
jgi:hypothetical protein